MTQPLNHKASRVFALFLISLCCAALSAPVVSAQGEAEIDPDDTISINTRLVNVTVTTTDSKSRPVDLEPSRIVLYADGVKQELVYAHSQNSPSNVALLVDVSDSMRGSVAKQTRFLIEKFLNAGDQRNRYTLFVFSGGTHMLGTFDGNEPGQRALLKKLENESYGGGTAIYQSARETLRHVLMSKPPMKTALVIFTDGIDNASPVGARLADELNSFGGFSCAFVIGQSPSFNMLESLYYRVPKSRTREIADQLEKQLGVETFVARGLNRDIEHSAERVAALMRSSIEVGFYPQEKASLPGTHNLRLEVTNAEDLNVKARNRYVIR